MIVIFLANTSTANPVFSSSSGKINGQDPSVFSDVHEIPTLSGLGEKITPQLTNKVFPPGVELPGGGGLLQFTHHHYPEHSDIL